MNRSECRLLSDPTSSTTPHYASTATHCRTTQVLDKKTILPNGSIPRDLMNCSDLIKPNGERFLTGSCFNRNICSDTVRVYITCILLYSLYTITLKIQQLLIGIPSAEFGWWVIIWLQLSTFEHQNRVNNEIKLNISIIIVY